MKQPVAIKRDISSDNPKVFLEAIEKRVPAIFKYLFHATVNRLGGVEPELKQLHEKGYWTTDMRGRSFTPYRYWGIEALLDKYGKGNELYEIAHLKNSGFDRWWNEDALPLMSRALFIGSLMVLWPIDEVIERPTYLELDAIVPANRVIVGLSVQSAAVKRQYIEDELKPKLVSLRRDKIKRVDPQLSKDSRRGGQETDVHQDGTVEQSGDVQQHDTGGEQGRKHGDLKARIAELAKEQSLKPNHSVDQEMVKRIFEKIQQEGFKSTLNSVRTTLQHLNYVESKPKRRE